MKTSDKYYLWKYSPNFSNEIFWVIIKGQTLEQKHMNMLMTEKCEGIVVKCCQRYKNDFSKFSRIPIDKVQDISLVEDETTPYDTLEDVLRMNFAFFLNNP